MLTHALKYWGKTTPGQNKEPNFHLLGWHSLDVAAVGQVILDNTRYIDDLTDLLATDKASLTPILVSLLALHDAGKFAASFQALQPFEPQQQLNASSIKTYDSTEFRHDLLGMMMINALSKTAVKNDDQTSTLLTHFNAIIPLVEPIVAHHGKPVLWGGPGNRRQARNAEKYYHPDNLHHLQHWIQAIEHQFNPQIPQHWLHDPEYSHLMKQASWTLAGLAIMADWIASSTHYVCYTPEPMPLSDYWQRALQQAEKAVASIKLFDTTPPTPFHDFQQAFSFQPTALQHWAETIELHDEPQLFILEDLTGSGKTEAALALTQRLIDNKLADSFYFGLPTMATANAMYSRLVKWMDNLFSPQDKPSLVLAHSGNNIHDDFQASLINYGEELDYHPDEQSASANCHRWFADSNKKALLARCGVGTIDQPLMAVIPQKHQAMRVFGCWRKVLIFDEVHVADPYMLTLMAELLKIHASHGGHAILLTATLSLAQKQQLLAAWHGYQPEHPVSDAFPVATRLSASQYQQTPITTQNQRRTAVNFFHHSDDAIEYALEQAGQGQSVVWIRNAVDDARDAWQAIRERAENPDRVLLYHSRFIWQDRDRIENDVLSHLNKDSKAPDRHGVIIIATQVFQESLDADTDIMISDICPIDDLIQRAGRLHRHNRNADRAYDAAATDPRTPPSLTVLAPEFDQQPGPNWLKNVLPSTEYVYRSPLIIWNTQRILREQGHITLKDNARILIEAVYGDQAQEPDGLSDKAAGAAASERMQINKAENILLQWQYGYNKESSRYWQGDFPEDISTRLSEILTQPVILVKKSNDTLVPFAASLTCDTAIHDSTIPNTKTSVQKLIQRSTLKLNKTKYADKLTTPGINQTETFSRQYRLSGYEILWLVEEDKQFGYDSEGGFFRLDD